MSAGFRSNLFTQEYFPRRPAADVPFGEILNRLFFMPIEGNEDFVLHGPNAIRFLMALVKDNLGGEIDLVKDSEVVDLYHTHHTDIIKALEAKELKEEGRVVELLRVASLFHDIGKFIRRANHPPIGANLLRNFDLEQRRCLVEFLLYSGEDQSSASKYNRFSLITSIIQHHDKFGVMSTGEGALPLFSDILYFTSDRDTLPGIRKNITSVMLANLADIAAVVPNAHPKNEKVRQGLTLAHEIWELRKQEASLDAEKDKLSELMQLCRSNVCLGLDKKKVKKVLEDWKMLIELVSDERVLGNRVKLKHQLLEIERNPTRAIKRILNLLEECASSCGCECLVDILSPISVESILVGTLGAHQFQTFCELLATVAKMDYSLNFFKAIICASVRKEIHEDYSVGSNSKTGRYYNSLMDAEKEQLAAMSPDEKARLVDKITTLFVKTIEGLLNRYIGVLGYAASSNPRRFGFQMRALSQDEKIRDVIIDLLCVQEHKDPIALTWLVDEVTIWSMD
ncbi:MAG TPA: HD domain-containing protein [Anaerolineales bacterium]|nr:HD domain-containing protein [Anaerolineales bacterium]